MNITKRSLVFVFLLAVLGFPLSYAYGDPPLGILSCQWNPPHIPDDDGDGQTDEDEIDGLDNEGDGNVDEDPSLPMCDWRACIDMGDGGISCSPYTLKYFRSADLLTTNTNIKRAIIVVHGRRDRRETEENRPIDYYNHIYNAADDLGLLNETLIIAPFFDRTTKCQVTAGKCDDSKPYVDNPRCGGNISSDDRLCWGGPDEDDYPSGGNAHNDDVLWTSSFSLLDSMVETLAYLKGDGTFPNLESIVVTGQSAGGQFTLRYSMAGSVDPDGITIRYVPCNPGTVTYLNPFRPTQEAKEAFPNIGYKWDLNGNGTYEPDEEFTPPGLNGILADTDDWSNYLSYPFEIPENSIFGDCISTGDYEKWPWGIADVDSANDYLATNVETQTELRARFLRRNVVLLNSIDDNFYVTPDSEWPDGSTVDNCMHELQGHSRLERNALFFKNTCLGYNCTNHAFEVVCVDGDSNGLCDFSDYCDDLNGNHVCDAGDFAYITMPCNDNNVNGFCEKRLMHGGVIYSADVTRQAVFQGLLSVPAETQWGKVMGGSGRELAVDVELTPAGGYIVLGETNSYGAGGVDFWVAALEDEGTILWQKTYGGSGDEYPTDIMASPDGGYLLAGNTSTSASGERDAWLVKIDENGALIWSRNYGDDLEDGVLAMSISADGNYLVAGNSFKEATLVDPRILYGWVMKLDLNGEKLWRKSFESSIKNSIYSLQPTLDGGCVFSGNYQVRAKDFWLVKLDQDGNIEREKVYGMNENAHPFGNENIESVPYVALTNDGGYFLVGPSFPILGGSGVIWILKLADDFSIAWQKMVGGTAGQCDPTSLQSTSDGGFIFSGHQFQIFTTTPRATFPYNRILMKFDSTGDPQWTIGYGVTNADKIYSVKQTTDGGYIGVGIAESFSLNNPDLWILKLDENGEIPDCPAIRALSYVTGAGPPEGPGDITTSVGSSLPATSSWTVTVTEPLPEDVIEGNGCMHVWDSVNLPRTGQTTSFYAGDDGDIRAGVAWPSPRFTDNGDGTVTDQLTGLIWLKDADCLGSSDWSTALSNVADFNDNPETYSCTDYDTENPKDDWRLPNVHELESLTTPTELYNATWLNGQGFVSVRNNWYWSSSYYRNSSTDLRWAVKMSDGRPSRDPHATGPLYWVWPVRGGQKGYADPNYPSNIPATGQTYGVAGSDGYLQMGVGWPPNRFLDNDDGTVTDRVTGLIWLKDARCFKDTETFNIHNWEEGLDAIADFNTDPGSFSCEDYDVEKHQTGWRMPNYKEFWSLMDRSEISPALTSGHPFLHTGPGITYWTSTTYAGSGSGSAWIATPTASGIFNDMIKSHPDPIVWPVRGPEVEAVDTDYDGIPDSTDNCPALFNPNQENSDGDGFGDICDAFPDDPAEWLDNDGDGIGNNADTDDDNDGMPDTWEIQYGLNPFVDNAADDTDGDGYTDLEEYQRGTNPTSSDDEFPWELFYPAFMKKNR